MMITAFVVCFVILCGTTCAQKCPENSLGQYPKCECFNGAVYDVTYNWCGSELNELTGECPADGPGVFPNCICANGKLFDAEKSRCVTINQSICPKRATGTPPNCKCGAAFVFDEVHWYCRPWYLNSTAKMEPATPQCNAFQFGTYPNCHWRPCRKDALNPNDHEPNCRYNYTKFVPCPHGMVGTPPDCHLPCPEHHWGKYPNCQRIRCQTGPGWSGEFAPNCTFNPKCPDEFPGIWPYCDLYKAKNFTVPNRNINSNNVNSVGIQSLNQTKQASRTPKTIQNEPSINTLKLSRPILSFSTQSPNEVRPTYPLKARNEKPNSTKITAVIKLMTPTEPSIHSNAIPQSNALVSSQPITQTESSKYSQTTLATKKPAITTQTTPRTKLMDQTKPTLRTETPASIQSTPRTTPTQGTRPTPLTEATMPSSTPPISESKTISPTVEISKTEPPSRIETLATTTIKSRFRPEPTTLSSPTSTFIPSSTDRPLSSTPNSISFTQQTKADQSMKAKTTTPSPFTYLPPYPTKKFTGKTVINTTTTSPMKISTTIAPMTTATTSSLNTNIPEKMSPIKMSPRRTTISVESSPAESCVNKCMSTCQDQCMIKIQF